MPTKTYYLDAARTDAVTASWGLFFRNFKIEHRGQLLGEVGSVQELRQGREFPLPDGRTLVVRLQQKFGAQGLDMQLDGRPVAGTVNDPQAKVQTAFVVLLFVAGLSGVLALVAIFGQVEFLLQLGVGWGALFEAAVYVGLAWLGKYRLKPWAFYVAGGLFVLDGVLLLASLAGTGGGVGGSVVVRILLAIAIFRGASGAKELQAAQAAEAKIL